MMGLAIPFTKNVLKKLPKKKLDEKMFISIM